MVDAVPWAEAAAAKFVVEYEDWSKVGVHDFGTVPVIVRYEFELQRRRASGPEIVARFTRFLDPKFKQTERWRGAAGTLGRLWRVRRQAVFESVSALRVATHGRLAEFHLVRREADGTEKVEWSPCWSHFPTAMLGIT